jgi:hypothetical protein
VKGSREEFLHRKHEERDEGHARDVGELAGERPGPKCLQHVIVDHEDDDGNHDDWVDHQLPSQSSLRLRRRHEAPSLIARTSSWMSSGISPLGYGTVTPTNGRISVRASSSGGTCISEKRIVTVLWHPSASQVMGTCTTTGSSMSDCGKRNASIGRSPGAGMTWISTPEGSGS